MNASKLVNLPSAVGILVVGYGLLAVYLGLVLKFEFLRSDVLGYWNDSLDWQHPFNPFHVPGYPLIIALARGISFDYVPPVQLMMSVSFVAFVVGALLVYKLISGAGIGRPYAVLGVLLFGLWPFVGLVYTVYPYADVVAMVFFLGGLYALQRSRLLVAAVLFGLLLLMHKAMWPFVGCTAIAWLSYHPNRDFRQRQIHLAALILLLPVGILWSLGSTYHGSVTWILSSNLRAELVSRSTLPVLDGLLGTVFNEGLKAIVKSGVVFGVAILSIALAYASHRSKAPESRYGMAIAASVLLLCVTLNHYEIWAAVRFSRLLVIPLVWSLGHRQGQVLNMPFGHKATRAAVPLIIMLLLFSQFIYAWYMAEVFFQ